MMFGHHAVLAVRNPLASFGPIGLAIGWFVAVLEVGSVLKDERRFDLVDVLIAATKDAETTATIN